MNDVRPAYLDIEGEIWQARVTRAIDALADCRACPRDCGVNRLENRWSACKTGRHAVVSSYLTQSGKEDCLRGWNGSGIMFVGHCNLRCVFCQSYDISQDILPQAAAGAAPRELAAMMLSLQM